MSDYSDSHWAWVMRTLGVPQKEPFVSAAKAAHEAIEFEQPNAKAMIERVATTMWAAEAEVLRFRAALAVQPLVHFEADMSLSRLQADIEYQLKYIVNDLNEFGDQELDPMFDPELNTPMEDSGGIDLGDLNTFTFPKRFRHLIDPLTRALYDSDFDVYNAHIAEVAQGMEEDGLGPADSFREPIDQFIMARLERLQAEYQGKRQEQGDWQKLKRETAENAPEGEKTAAVEYLTTDDARMELFVIPPAAIGEFDALVTALAYGAEEREVRELLLEAHEAARAHNQLFFQMPYDLFRKKADREAAKLRLPLDVMDKIEIQNSYDNALDARLEGLHGAEKKAIARVIEEVAAGTGLTVTEAEVKARIDISVDDIAKNERGPEKLRDENGHIRVPARFGDGVYRMMLEHSNDMPDNLRYEAEELLTRMRKDGVDVRGVTVDDLAALPRLKEQADANLAQLMALAEAGPVDVAAPAPDQAGEAEQEDSAAEERDPEPEETQNIDPIPEATYREWLSNDDDFGRAVEARRAGDPLAERHFLNLARVAIDRRYNIILNDDELSRSVTAAIGGRFADMSFDEMMDLDEGPTALDDEYARQVAAGERLPEGDTRNELDDLFEPVYDARHEEGVDEVTRNENAYQTLVENLIRNGKTPEQAQKGAAFLRLSGVSKT